MNARGVGFAIGPARVPIVAGAILFDLAVGSADAYPDEAAGEAACEAAREGEIETGRDRSGHRSDGREDPRHRPRGPRRRSARPPSSFRAARRVAALAAVESPSGTSWIPTPEAASPDPARGTARFLTARALARRRRFARARSRRANTTLVCVATDVAFDQASLKRVAIEAHDGLARAVRPAHTVVDGDIAFALAPAGRRPLAH